MAAAAVLPLLPRNRVPAAARRTARALLAALGVSHAAHGQFVTRRALVVANHVSWLDIVVLAAYLPARLLAKREVWIWPVIGRLAVATGTLFIDRDRPRDLPAAVASVTGALAADGLVVAFPEGTTRCGRTIGRLRPALFHAAVTAKAAVVPVRLDFALADGGATTVAAFVGTDSLLASVGRVVTTRGLTIGLRAYPSIDPGPDSGHGKTRRALAAAAQTVFASESRSGRRFRHDEHAVIGPAVACGPGAAGSR
jgi:1-acyl-sn-glycerol-3-phosphate acyltransferase